jgi:hypothetical protein
LTNPERDNRAWSHYEFPECTARQRSGPCHS